MSIVSITVTKAHMKLGLPKDGEICAASYAIREALNLEEVVVDENVWGWGRRCGVIQAASPLALTEFIAAYDTYESGHQAAHQMQEVTFTLEVEDAE